VESEEMTLGIAERVRDITTRLKIPYIFKASYRKANRSRGDSFTGIGDEPSLQILDKVRRSYQLPILTDIHTSEEAATAAVVADVLQIPAFLCRQTDLLVAAGKTGKTVNIVGLKVIFELFVMNTPLFFGKSNLHHEILLIAF